VVIKPLLHQRVSLKAVVVGNGKVLKAYFHCFISKGLGGEAAITAKGVAVEIESFGASCSCYLLEHSPEGMLKRH
jgi:hypothetical protein